MNQTIPEIRVSNSDNMSENELQSDIATDTEYLDIKPAAPLLKRTNRIDDEQLTDLEKSSSDDDDDNDENEEHAEKKTTMQMYPLESLNRAFDICMNCEEITNVKGPTKLRSKITLDRIKFNDFIKYENLTDLEDFSDSDFDFEVNEFNEYDGTNYYLETAHVTAIKDDLTGIRSPLHTPEPGFKQTSYSMQLSPIEDCCTDSEMIYTEQASTSKKRLTIPIKMNKYPSGTCSSDTDEEFLQENKEKIKNMNKKFNYSQKFNVNKTVSLPLPKKGNLQPLKQKDSPATDVETIDLNISRQRSTKKCQAKKPSTYQRANTTGTSRKTKPFKDQNPEQKWHSTHLHFNQDTRRNFNSSSPDFRGGVTDIEAFDSDEEFCFDDIKPIAFIPEASNDLVLTCENHKGGVSLVLPFNGSSSRKMISNRAANESSGFTDVEVVSDVEETKPRFCRTPDLPISEQSIIRNVENLIEKCNLKVHLDHQDPLTDTEEVDIEKFERKVKYSVKGDWLNPNLIKDKESVTDVEDLSDDDARSAPAEQLLAEQSDTESDIISADDAEDDHRIYRTVTPELNSDNTYTATKEGIGPFPLETKRKMNETFYKVQRVKSPSPPPDPTDVEEMQAASMDEEQQNNAYTTDEDNNIETHQSVVHIQHTRKFRTEGIESLHIKHCDNRPDPSTDIEEIPAIEERPKKSQKTKSNSDKCTVSFNKSSSGYSCKWQNHKGAGCSKHEGKVTTIGAKVSQKSIDVTKIKKGEEESLEMAIGQSETKTGSGKSSSTQPKK